MKKSIRRLLAALLCLLLCAALSPAALADSSVIASGDCGYVPYVYMPNLEDYYYLYSERDPVSWTLTSDGVLTISGTGRIGWVGVYNRPWSEYSDRITSVVINSGVTSIPSYSFSSCSRLKSVAIPDTVVNIDSYAFSNCISLGSVSLPVGITVIPRECFFGCSALKSVDLPSGLTQIDECAFSSCTALSSLSLPSALTNIGDEAFANCISLSSVAIPSAVTDIGSGSFRNCSSLAAFSVASGNNRFASEDGVLFNKDKTLLVFYPSGKSGDYTMPSSVNTIKANAFAYCKKLGKVTVSSNVSAIPMGCFSNARLSEISFPSSLLAIDKGAFSYTSGLSSVVFPASLKTIGSNAFHESSSLISATFPASLESIGDYAFEDCSQIRTLNFLGNAPEIGQRALYFLRDGDEYVKAFYPASASGWNQLVKNGKIQNRIEWLPYDAKPNVKTNPKTQTVYPGETASFTAEADTNVAYQWYYRTGASGEWKLYSGKTDSTLNVTATAACDGYQYRCKMTNPLGTATTYAAALHVSAPKITVQPKDKTAAVGDTAQFAVKAKGASSYQWQYYNTSTNKWENVTNSSYGGLKTDTMSVPATKARSGMKFRCKVTNAIGTVYSDAATLTVLRAPSITNQPKGVTTAPGLTVSFSVKASGDQLSYQWQFRPTSADGWSNCSASSARTEYFTVTAESYRNGYQYRCKVSNSVGTVISDIVTLTVIGKPTITTQPSNKSAVTGATVTFTVAASNATSYQWQFRPSSADGWSNSSASSAKTASFTVTAESYRNGYQYRCKVSNANGTVYSNAATLTVTSDGKPTITTQPSNKSAAIGATVTFTVAASGATSYQWQFRPSSADGWSNCSAASAKTASFTLTAESYRNGYQYRCKVSNANGTVYSSSATLTVTSS